MSLLRKSQEQFTFLCDWSSGQILQQVFRTHSFPRDIVSLRPRTPVHFNILQGVLPAHRLIGASTSHPESNNETERLNQQLETGLRCLVSENPSTWHKHLDWVEFAHNSLPLPPTCLLSSVFLITPPLSSLPKSLRLPFCLPTP